ncbi:MAG: HlyD family secretion protein [Gemmataceae bacterium]
MASARRPSWFLWVFGLLLLGGSIGGMAWYFRDEWRPAVEAPPPDSKTRSIGFGHVDVEGGIISIYPAQPGRVQYVRVQENQHVDKGDILLELDDFLAQKRLAEAQAAERVVQTQVELARQLETQYHFKVRQLEAGIEAAQQAQNAAAADLRRQQHLVSIQARGTKETLEAAEANVKRLEAMVRVEEIRLEELKSHSQDAKLQLERALAELEAAKARVEQAAKAVQECQVRAPMAGTPLRVQVNPGEMVTTQMLQAPILFRPDLPLIVRAEVAQEFASGIFENQPVEVEDEMLTQGPKWKGKVKRISNWFARRRSMLLEPGQLNDVRTLECVIELDQEANPKTPPLRIGQRVRVRFLSPPGAEEGRFNGVTP